MRNNVLVLSIAGLGGAWWIGSHVTELMTSRSQVVVEKEPGRSGDMTGAAAVGSVSPFDVVEIRSGSLQTQTGASSGDSSDSHSLVEPDATLRSLQALLEQPLTGVSETALLDELQAWSVTEPAEAAHWIERTLSEAPPGSTVYALVYPLLYQWVEIQPEVALAQVGAFADEDEIPYLMLSHAERLAEERTPAEALEWARSIEDDASSEFVVDGVLQRWLERDVTAMATQLESENPELQYGSDATGYVAHVDDQSDSVITNDFQELVATALIEQDPGRALQWADALPGASAEEVQSEAFDSWMAQDPVAAGDWLSGTLVDTGTLPVSLASTVPTRDINLAINTLPLLSGAPQRAMTSAIVETLSEDDPDNARAWVEALADPQERSTAATVWARANAERQPAEALEGALEATQGHGRLDVLMDVAAKVAQTNQPLLESWLAAAPLSDYERSQLASVVFDDTGAYPFE